MDIRPTDLPELRAELCKSIASDCGEFSLDGTSRTWPAQVFDAADMFHVSGSMSALARVARESLDTFAPDAYDVPSPCGMIYFEDGTGDSVTFACGDTAGARGAFWIHDEGCLMVLPFGDDHPDRSGITPATLIPYREGLFYVPLDGTELHSASENSAFTADRFVAVLLTAWILMRQPLAEASIVEVDRAARKRLRRQGREPAPVRVIELRRPKSSGEHGDGENSYQHQWIVRGHWRNHWHPKREVHRPVWISPHVKGPEGAPMIGGEKVYAWKR